MRSVWGDGLSGSAMLAGDYVDWLSSERVMKEKETRTRSGKKKTRISLMFNLIQKKVTGEKYSML